jgi:hypothetical protein
MNELIEKLKKITEKSAKCDREDFDLDGYAGGNIDDAYEIGYNDGRIHLAQDLLATLEKLT